MGHACERSDKGQSEVITDCNVHRERASHGSGALELSTSFFSRIIWVIYIRLNVVDLVHRSSSSLIDMLGGLLAKCHYIFLPSGLPLTYALCYKLPPCVMENPLSRVFHYIGKDVRSHVIAHWLMSSVGTVINSDNTTADSLVGIASCISQTNKQIEQYLYIVVSLSWTELYFTAESYTANVLITSYQIFVSDSSWLFTTGLIDIWRGVEASKLG